MSIQLDYEIIGYNYTYDDLGRITQITDVDDNIQNTYTYDGLGRMTRENNRSANETYVYTYDNYGNILTKKTYAYTTGTLGTVKSTVNYGYSSTTWRDQLTSYSGSAITYDGIGNPLTWRNGMRFVWMAGRQLSAATNSSGVTYGYAYNNDGIRYEKIGGGVTTNYYLDGSTVLAESRSNGTKIIYRHDESGNYVGFILNGVDYYYIYNAQGDVVALVDTYGEVAAKYYYDAWGKLIKVTNSSGVTITSSTHVGNINPIRYRGYYYDVETGLYYLQSRYYDHTVGRFINADGILSEATTSVDGKNLYAYCDNDPVNYADDSGLWKSPHTAFGLFGFGPILKVNSANTQKNNTEKKFVDNFKNEDGSYSLIDNHRNTTKPGVFHDQFFVWNVSGPSASLKSGKLTLGSYKFQLTNSGWEWDNFELTLLSFGNLQASAGVQEGKLNVGAIASIWSPSTSFKILDLNITVSANIGSIGKHINIDTTTGQLSYGSAIGCGYDISIDW